jgi:hypothetical protein
MSLKEPLGSKDKCCNDKKDVQLDNNRNLVYKVQKGKRLAKGKQYKINYHNQIAKWPKLEVEVEC